MVEQDQIKGRACVASVVAAMVMLAGFASRAAWAAAPAASVPAALTGIFKTYSPGTNEITITLEQSDRTLQLGAAGPEARRLLRLARAGDVLTVDVDDAVEPETISKLDAIQRPVAAATRLLYLGVATLVALLATSLAAQGRPQRFVIGVDNRYSNSQFQLAAWFVAVAIVYLGTVMLRIVVLGWDFVGGVGITENIAALSGLSALTFGGAKVITVRKVDALAQAGMAPAKVPAARPNLLTDLFTNDNKQADLGDFQMILVTVAAVAIFVVTTFHWLHLVTLSPTVTLPDVDSTLLTGFGVGQGAYLIKKAALRAGEG